MLSVNVRRHSHDGVIDLILAGRLDASTTPMVRSALLKCVVEHPRAILVDVNLVTGGEAAWRVFGAVRRAPAFDDTQIGLILHTRSHKPLPGNEIPVYADRAAAMAAVDEGPHPRRRWLHLAPSARAGQIAARFIADACYDWALDDLAEVAGEVAQDLVNNAVLQAGTDMVVTVHLGPGNLHLNVHDFSREPPRLAYTEMTLADAVTAGWGTFVTADGKHVWANFPLVQAQLSQ